MDPSQPRGKWQISTAGGELPRWRRDGKELYYHFGTQYFAVDVKTDGPSFVAGVPRLLFEAHAVGSTGSGGSPYGVTTITGAIAAAKAIVAMQKGDWDVRPLQDYFAKSCAHAVLRGSRRTLPRSE